MHDSMKFGNFLLRSPSDPISGDDRPKEPVLLAVRRQPRVGPFVPENGPTAGRQAGARRMTGASIRTRLPCWENK